MSPPFSIFLIILSLLSLSRSDSRLHGLDDANEDTIAPISPQTYEFFNPRTTKADCRSPDCKTLPLAATVMSTPAQESTTWSGHRGLGASGFAAVCLSVVFVCIVGIGSYYVMIKRRANLSRANADV